MDAAEREPAWSREESSPKAGLPVLRGERCLLRPVTPEDVGDLAKILGEPSVSCWWGNYDLDKVRAEFLEDDSAVFVIEALGDAGPEVAGSIQYFEENEPEYRHAGIDIFVGTRHQGRGLGPDAIRTLARHLFEDRGHHRLTIDPAVANERAVAAYRKVGFRPVGIMRQYERSPEGQWRDGLLMDLLKEELA
jgi:aminoglycoside 6'-N-acetyltransferase